MSKELKCIMLIDDNPDDNFFHEREIKKNNIAKSVVTQGSGTDALEYIVLDKKPSPDIIFLDINMPGMNGWEFLKEYDKLEAGLKNSIIIIMLTTSDNPDDAFRAEGIGAVSDYITKPLTAEILKTVLTKYFGSSSVNV